MRLQLISFAWRILNTPVADFAAVMGARDNSIRELMEREEPPQPPAPALPWPRGSNPPGFGENSWENENKSYRLQSVWLGGKALLWWIPMLVCQHLACLVGRGKGDHPQMEFLVWDPAQGPTCQLGSAGDFYLVVMPAGLAPERIKT